MHHPIRLFVAAAMLAAPMIPAASVQAAAAADWTKTVAATPEGGFRVGNPKAPVALVEYGSLTCPHCAEFVKTGIPPLLANHVKSGKVSFEFRNMVLNGLDVAASLLARCAGPRDFFRVVDGMYRSQSEWTSKIIDLSEAQKQELGKLPKAEQLARLAELSGLMALASAGGVTAAKGKACLADKAAADRLRQMYEGAVKLGVKGTPAFLINGKRVDAHDWADLEPLIRKAGG